MVLYFLDQLHIFWHFYLIELLIRSFVATRAVALDIFKARDNVLHAGRLHKLKYYRVSGQIFGLISSFLSNRWLLVVLNGKSSQEYPVNAGVPQWSIFGLHFSYYTLMTFLMMQFVVLVYMLIIQLCNLSVINHLICGNN